MHKMCENSSDPEEKKQLRKEKEQLRDKENQLREEKLIFLRRQENSGNSINSMSYQQNEKNLTMPMPLIISPSIHQ
jgi:Na+/phosphate symporter